MSHILLNKMFYIRLKYPLKALFYNASAAVWETTWPPEGSRSDPSF
jgi:hypothetical protein